MGDYLNMKLKFGMLFFVVMIVLSTNAISVINGKTMIMNSNEGNIHEDPAYFIQSNNTSNLPKLLKLLLLSFLFGISLIFLLKQYVSSQKIDYVLVLQSYAMLYQYEKATDESSLRKLIRLAMKHQQESKSGQLFSVHPLK